MSFPEQPNSPSRWRVSLILLLGIGAASTAAILTRFASLSVLASLSGFSLVIAATRMGFAALLLAPLWRNILSHRPSGAALRWAIAAGFALALHFASWITSLSYTSIAASTTLVTTNPLWVTLLSWWWYGDKPRLLTWLGIGIALLGSSFIGFGSQATAIATHPALGNGLALVGAIAASFYFLLGREAQQRGLSISHYAAIAYTTAAIFLFPIPFWLGLGYTGYSVQTYLYLLLIALIPQLVGHTSLNWAIRWVSPTQVALTILLEPVFSSVLAVILFKEIPSSLTWLGIPLLLLGVGVTAFRPAIASANSKNRDFASDENHKGD